MAFADLEFGRYGRAGKRLATSNVQHLAPESLGPGGGGGIRYMALVVTPSEMKSKPRAGAPGKRDFPGTSRLDVVLIGPPCGENRVVGPGVVRHETGHWASMPSSHLGYNDDLPEDAVRGDDSKRVVIEGDKRAYMFDGAIWTLEAFGITVRATHRRDETKYSDGETGESIYPGMVVMVGIDKPLLDGQSQVGKCKYLRVLLNQSTSLPHANEVLYGIVSAAQNTLGPNVSTLPIHPPQLAADIDWSKVVVTKTRENSNNDYQPAPDQPTLEKISTLKSKALDGPSRSASFRRVFLPSVTPPKGLTIIRDMEHGWILTVTSNVLFDHDNPDRFIDGKESNPATVMAKQKYRPDLKVRTETVCRMEIPGHRSVEVRIFNTLPAQAMPQFGAVDPDLQVHTRMFIKCGVWVMRSSMMINQFFKAGTYAYQDFKVSAYPALKYTDKVPDWSTLYLYVDPAPTVINGCLPVSRLVASAAMIGLMKSRRTPNQTRFKPRMDEVSINNKLNDSQGKPIRIDDNPWHQTRNSREEEVVVNLTECKRDIVKSYPFHAFFVLVDSLLKGDQHIQEAFQRFADPGNNNEIRAGDLISYWDNQLISMICLRNDVKFDDMCSVLYGGMARVRHEVVQREMSEETWLNASAPLPPEMKAGFFHPKDPGMTKPAAADPETYHQPTIAALKKTYMDLKLFEQVPREELNPALLRLVPETPENASNMRPPGLYSDDQPFAGAVIPFAIDAEYARKRDLPLYTAATNVHRKAFESVEKMRDSIKGLKTLDQLEKDMEISDKEAENAARAAEDEYKRKKKEEENEVIRQRQVAEQKKKEAEANVASELASAAAAVDQYNKASAPLKKRPVDENSATKEQEGHPDEKSAAEEEEGHPDEKSAAEEGENEESNHDHTEWLQNENEAWNGEQGGDEELPVAAEQDDDMDQDAQSML